MLSTDWNKRTKHVVKQVIGGRSRWRELIGLSIFPIRSPNVVFNFLLFLFEVTPTVHVGGSSGVVL